MYMAAIHAMAGKVYMQQLSSHLIIASRRCLVHVLLLIILTVLLIISFLLFWIWCAFYSLFIFFCIGIMIVFYTDNSLIIIASVCSL